MAQEFNGVKELLVDGLDGTLREFLFFLGARAQAALNTKAGRDKPEVAGLLTHGQHFVFETLAVFAALARYFCVQERDVQDGKHGDEASVTRKGGSGAGRGARAEGHHGFEAQGSHGQ